MKNFKSIENFQEFNQSQYYRKEVSDSLLTESEHLLSEMERKGARSKFRRE